MGREDPVARALPAPEAVSSRSNARLGDCAGTEDVRGQRCNAWCAGGVLTHDSQTRDALHSSYRIPKWKSRLHTQVQRACLATCIGTHAYMYALDGRV